jgi:SRSO17 transposase
VTGVLADAEFGDNGLFRAVLHRLRLPYAVGISSQLTIFRGTPHLVGHRPLELTLGSTLRLSGLAAGRHRR